MPVIENEGGVAVADKPAKAKKTAKAGGKGKVVNKAAKKSAGERKPSGEPRTEPTGSQIKILKAMQKSKTEEVTYADVRKATGINRGLVKLMAAESSKGNKHAGSLEDLGLIKSSEIEHMEGGPRARFYFKLTAKGRSIAQAN